MKLIVCICQNKYVNEVVQQLGDQGYRSTKLASHGGFLKKGNTTLLIGINNDQKEHVMQIIEAACNKEDARKSRTAKDPKQNRATVFVVNTITDLVG